MLDGKELHWSLCAGHFFGSNEYEPKEIIKNLIMTEKRRSN